MTLRQMFRQGLRLAGEAFRSEVGAFSITNPVFTSIDAIYPPVGHKEIADLTMSSSTATSSTVNTGIVGLRQIRVRARLKTLGGIAAGETFVVTVQAGTGAAITAPEQILHKSVTMLTGDLGITVDAAGWSQNGFQSYAVTISSSGTARTGVADIMVDCV